VWLLRSLGEKTKWALSPNYHLRGGDNAHFDLGLCDCERQYLFCAAELEDAGGFGEGGAGSGYVVDENDFLAARRIAARVRERETSFDVLSPFKNVFRFALRFAVMDAREQMFVE